VAGAEPHLDAATGAGAILTPGTPSRRLPFFT
jgi:hypothetical protein